MSSPRVYQPNAMEQEVLQTWRDQDTFRKQVAQGRENYLASGKNPATKFVFLEGPPTANGLPHPGHVLTRALKDTVNRYHAMLGKWVPRKAGWDCHGLPVEIEVQKELGIEHVEEIEKYGIGAFNEKCRQSVFKYKDVWEKMSERVGFWADYENPYVTMDDDYIESVWWSLKKLHDAGLLIRSYKVVPYCPLTGTSYSSHEVAQGYKDVVDTSVFVKFHLVDDPDNARVLSWTTTPWTLPGNVALAVGDDIDYVKVRVLEESDKAIGKKGEVLILAKALMKRALRNHSEIIAEFKGRELVGKSYVPLFPGAVDISESKQSFVVIPADFVTTEDGSGVVHTAVMYGEDDYRVGMAAGLPAKHTVGLDGNFVASVPRVAGMYVKAPETENAILDYLRESDYLYRDEAYEHTYPHCWRTGAPLLYYAMESWYIRMSELRDQLLANNQTINWVPETIRDGRMGNWLENVKDWAFSRKRYWGTPLPIWVCQDENCATQTCLGSKADLAAHGIKVKELHRPYVDEPIKCPKCGGVANREPYVIDVWYDSGAAQFAQWGLGEEGKEHLEDQWPIDFISEGLDQTRGWFYSLLASATALGNTDAKMFNQAPYKNVIVNGLILAEDGQKMSKSKKNYVSPDLIFETQGVDATRWYLLSASAPWQDKRFFEGAVRDTFGKFFSTLWNTFLFYDQYASLDKYKPSLATLDNIHEIVGDSHLDRWVLSRLESTIQSARTEMDRFHLHKAARAIEDFVVLDLSNWWVRRSRDRFWAETESEDKQSAYAALWWCLHSVCRLVAPFAPFMVEHIWKHVRLPEDPTSVHLSRYPEAGATDAKLETQMAQVRELAENGRALRSKIGIPTRHPLARAIVVGAELGELASILQEEINVKTLALPTSAREAKRYLAKPNRSKLGPSFRQLATQVADAIESLDGDHAFEAISEGRTIAVNIAGHDHIVTADHITWETEDRDGWATIDVGGATLAYDTNRTPELHAEAFAREIIRRIQELRKELDLAIDDGIEVILQVSPAAHEQLTGFADEIASEVRSAEIRFEKIAVPLKLWTIGDEHVGCMIAGYETRIASAA